MLPELPPDDEPDENTSIPLDPLSPAFAVRTVMLPLELAVPSPDDIHIAPPVATTLRPATNDTVPP